MSEKYEIMKKDRDTLYGRCAGLKEVLGDFEERELLSVAKIADLTKRLDEALVRVDELEKKYVDKIDTEQSLKEALGEELYEMIVEVWQRKL